MESIVRYAYDDLLKLQPIGAAAITATTVAPNKVDLNHLVNGRGDLKNRYGEYEVAVVVHVSAADFTTGDETYALQFCTYDSAGANETVQESVTITSAQVGETLNFEFQTDTLGRIHPAAAQIGVKAVLGGTTPSLTYWAFASAAE